MARAEGAQGAEVESGQDPVRGNTGDDGPPSPPVPRVCRAVSPLDRLRDPRPSWLHDFPRPGVRRCPMSPSPHHSACRARDHPRHAQHGKDHDTEQASHEPCSPHITPSWRRNLGAARVYRESAGKYGGNRPGRPGSLPADSAAFRPAPGVTMTAALESNAGWSEAPGSPRHPSAGSSGPSNAAATSSPARPIP